MTGLFFLLTQTVDIVINNLVMTEMSRNSKIKNVQKSFLWEEKFLCLFFVVVSNSIKLN